MTTTTTTDVSIGTEDGHPSYISGSHPLAERIQAAGQQARAELEQAIDDELFAESYPVMHQGVLIVKAGKAYYLAKPFDEHMCMPIGARRWAGHATAGRTAEGVRSVGTRVRSTPALAMLLSNAAQADAWAAAIWED